MPSGANGLPLPAAAPTVNTRKNVPIASTAYLTPARGAAAALLACSPVNTRRPASCAVTMTPRLVAQGTHVVSAVTQLRLLTALLPDYLPASISPINVAPAGFKNWLTAAGGLTRGSHPPASTGESPDQLRINSPRNPANAAGCLTPTPIFVAGRSRPMQGRYRQGRPARPDNAMSRSHGGPALRREPARYPRLPGRGHAAHYRSPHPGSSHGRY